MKMFNGFMTFQALDYVMCHTVSVLFLNISV